LFVYAADHGQKQIPMGSLAGAAHPLKDNEGVQRATQKEQKSFVEYKGKSCFETGVQYAHVQ